jgi:hypothetical protein
MLNSMAAAAQCALTNKKKLEVDFRPMVASNRMWAAASSHLTIHRAIGFPTLLAWAGRPRPYQSMEELEEAAGGWHRVLDLGVLGTEKGQPATEATLKQYLKAQAPNPQEDRSGRPAMREILRRLSERDPGRVETGKTTPLSAFRTKWLFPFILPAQIRALDETRAGEIAYDRLQLVARRLRDLYKKLGLQSMLLSPPCGGPGLEDKTRTQEARAWRLLGAGHVGALPPQLPVSGLATREQTSENFTQEQQTTLRPNPVPADTTDPRTVKLEPEQTQRTETRLQRVKRQLATSSWTLVETRGSDITWEPERWLKMVMACRETRWQPIFQEVKEDLTTEGDGMRHQLVLGLRAHSEEIKCVEQLQAVHDAIFEVRQIRPGLHHQRLDSDPKGLAGTRTKKEDPTKTDWTRRYGMARVLQPGTDPEDNRNPRVTAALRSRPPCATQHGHADALFNPRDGTTGYLSLLAPLNAPVKLRIWTGCHKLMELHHNRHGMSMAQWSGPQPELEAEGRRLLGLGPHDILAPEEIEVQVGQMILFVAHAPHQGAAWCGPGDNIRLHTYLYPVWVPFPANTTTVLLPAWINKICGITTEAGEHLPAERETQSQRRARQSCSHAATDVEGAPRRTAGEGSPEEVIVIDSDEDEFVGLRPNRPGVASTGEPEPDGEVEPHLHSPEGMVVIEREGPLLETHTDESPDEGREDSPDVLGQAEPAGSTTPYCGVGDAGEFDLEGEMEPLLNPPGDMEVAGGEGNALPVGTPVDTNMDESIDKSCHEQAEGFWGDEAPGSAAASHSGGLGAAGTRRGGSNRTPVTHLLALSDASWATYTSRQRRNKKRRWNRANRAGGARQVATAGAAPNEADSPGEDPDSPEKEENPGRDEDELIYSLAHRDRDDGPLGERARQQ